MTPPPPPSRINLGLLALGLGGALVIALVAWLGARVIGREVLAALWVLPLTLGLHAVQLWLSAVAWRIATGQPGPGVGRYVVVRWVREAVNSMLPVAQLGGNVVGVRLLAQQGVPAMRGGAGVTLDMTVEAVTQFLFTLAGIAALAAISPDRSWAPWAEGFVALSVLALAGFILAQRVGLMRLIEAAADRIPFVPKGLLHGLQAEWHRLQADRAALLRASLLHMLAWLLGIVETWLALGAMGHTPSLAAALVVDSLGMAARSAGFAIPGALGVQEAGFILAAGMVGQPPEAAIALSMLKRARELVVGVTGLAVWQWVEGRRLARK
jgi:putative membrane protein